VFVGIVEAHCNYELHGGIKLYPFYSQYELCFELKVSK